MRRHLIFSLILSLSLFSPYLFAQDELPLLEKGSEQPISRSSPYPIFDDKMLLEGYSKNYNEEPLDILLAMIQDETLSPYKTAAAVRVFKQNFSQEIFAREKGKTEKVLLRRLNRTDSPFVQVEIMHTLLRMDRYKYFKSMVPTLIQKLEHYNTTVNDLAYTALTDIIEKNTKRSREARIVFNTLRKILFLSRRRLTQVKNPDQRLKNKLELLRWSMKILGTEEIKRLPKEVINLL